jgi:hypothetical protein
LDRIGPTRIIVLIDNNATEAEWFLANLQISAIG